jgi:hypothetical protein
LLTGGALEGTTGPILEEAATCRVSIDSHDGARMSTGQQIRVV